VRRTATALGVGTLEARKTVERAFEDQLLQRDRCVERIADRVSEPAVAFEARVELGRALRMDEKDGAELFGLGPDRMVLGLGKALAQHAAADGGAAQALLLHRGLQLLERGLGILQRERREGADAVGLGRDPR